MSANPQTFRLKFVRQSDALDNDERLGLAMRNYFSAGMHPTAVRGRIEPMDESHSMPASMPAGSHDSAWAVAEEAEALLSRCALRDQQALADLYALIAGRLLGLLVRMLKNRAVAEDALQDVMVRIWQRADQYSAYRGRAVAWIMSIARYRAIDLLRAQRTHIEIDQVSEAALMDPVTEAANEAAASERALNECFRRLTADQRRCLALAYVDGCSHNEIATTMASPLGTVKSWVRRGLASLKSCIESWTTTIQD